MPSIERFIELFEAFSRRDFDEIRKVGQSIAEEEKLKKHYSAANRIMVAIEISLSNSGYDLIASF